MPELRITALRGLQLGALSLLLVAFAPAQADNAGDKPNYKLAQRFSANTLKSLTYSTAIKPNWIGKTDVFWYSYRTSQGNRFWRVDPARKLETPLFDHEKLATQLTELTRRPVDSVQLPLDQGKMSDDSTKFSFVVAEVLYEFDLKAEKLVSKGKAPPASRFPGPSGEGGGGGRRRFRGGADSGAESDVEGETPQEVEKREEKDMGTETDRTKGPPAPPVRGRSGMSTSPDKKSVLLTRGNNLYLAEAGKEKDAIALTKDGSEEYSVELAPSFGRGAPGGLTPRATTWASDSNHFHATRRDSRGVQDLFVIDSLGSPRPKLEKYRYAMPGEASIRKSELLVGSRETRRAIQVTPKWKDESYSDLHWGKKPGELRFVRRDRLMRNQELCAVDARTGECRILVSEGFDNAPLPLQAPSVRYLTESDRMICWSERSGWGHFYLHDRDGKLENAITSGAWRASRIVAVDEKKRQLYVEGNGREKGENVYYQHLYRVGFDGSGLTCLDPGDSNHFSELSPSRQFVVDNTSRVDQCPESVLRDASGNKVMELKKADLSRLREHGWRPPESFVVKAADGVTDLYGNMWKPVDFDPKKKYPIIAYVYPGPQMEGVTHTFRAASTNMQLAQIGFIVIEVGHRGGAPTRSKAYASYGYNNLRDYALEDKKAAIEGLAARFDWIDLGRVGIFGHSGGGFMSAAAVLQKPYNDFFKVAVASAGNHDNNIYNNGWAERYHGMKEVPVKPEGETPAAPPVKIPPLPKTKFEIKVPTNAELAANLKGRLLLVHGELDNNVHPANTMRLVDALIKANKRFDMLILPGKRHGFGDYQPYFTQRMFEYFAEHLLGDRQTGADLGAK